MSFYIFLYFSVSFFLIYIGYIFLKKYRNIGGLGFFMFTIFTSFWIIFFLLTYFSTSNLDYLLQISRLTYGTSLLSIYSLLIFIIYFDKINKNIYLNKYLIGIIIFIVFFSFLTFFSPYIIESLYYNDSKNDFYEKPGMLFDLYLFLELIILPIFLYFVIKKYKFLYNLNKVRFKFILLGIFIYSLFGLFFQLILPSFGIYILEKEVVLFILPFLFLSWYSISRYHFSDFSFRYKNILSFLLSILSTILLFSFIKNYSLNFSDNFIGYWGFNLSFNNIDLILSIIIYLFFYKLYFKFIPGNTEYNRIIIIINKWKEYIPFITNLKDLNYFLKRNIKKEFNISFSSISLFDKNYKYKELYNYFSKDVNNDLFINDFVFIEENKNKFNIDLILPELNKDVYLIFPLINNKNNVIGIFELGNKPFKEQFFIEEIKIIKGFVNFLVGHLKYIEIYSKINDLNLNLDKKVDEKTIEFNNLINKQKEFISMSSHEIKTPIMAASMHIENFVDDIEDGYYDENYLKKESNLLKEQIFKISDLVKNIFNVQKYEIKDVGLYIEKVKISDLIIGEYDILSKIYPEISFKINIKNEILFIDLDKIQFTQVISNLLNNAIKFSDKSKPKIKISIGDLKDKISIVIEDNGSGFKPGEETDIFDKYSTGHGNSIGIGMGLYLCKKIVELHDGKIFAKNSEELKGAMFEILIPKKQQ